MRNVATSKGCFTQGEFILPGYYSQFVIESPGYNLTMKLIIKGLVDSPFPDPWRPNNWYCVRKGKCDMCLDQVYTNILDNVSGNTVRVVSDKYKHLQDKVRQEFFTNPRFPCFTTTTRSASSNTFTMEVNAYYKKPDGDINPHNSTNTFVYLFNLPSNICDISSDVVASFDDIKITSTTDLAQSFNTYFTLVKGIYQMFISIKLTSVTWNDLVDAAKLNLSLVGPPTIYTPNGVVKKRCEDNPIQLKLINNNSNEVIFAANLSEPSFVRGNDDSNSFLETTSFPARQFELGVTTNCSFAVFSTVWSYGTKEGDEVQVGGCNAEMTITIKYL